MVDDSGSCAVYDVLIANTIRRDHDRERQHGIDLVANIPGEFEVELEDAHLLLFSLRVS